MGLRRSKRSAFVVTVPLVVMLAVGCSYDWSFTPDPTAGGVGIGSVGDAGSSSGDGAVDGGTDATILPDRSDPKPSEGFCKSSAECPPTSFCQFADKACGADGRGGVCVSFDVVCKAPSSDQGSVCTCRGTRADNLCLAAMDRLDVNLKGQCGDALPSETFACPGAERACLLKLEYCRVDKLAEKGSCLPANCDGQDQCSCIQLERCSCQSPSIGAAVVTCSNP